MSAEDSAATPPPAPDAATVEAASAASSATDGKAAGGGAEQAAAAAAANDDDNATDLTAKEKKKRKKRNKKKKKKKQDAAAAAKSEKEELLNLLGMRRMRVSHDKKAENAAGKAHRFWDTQPVPKISESVGSEEFGPIDAEKTPDQVRQEPYVLPGGFHWSTIDVEDEKQMKEVYTLLTENYVEDDDNMFRFDYSIPFLKWALQPPGYFQEWHVGVRQTNNNKLRGFITGVPAHVKVHAADIKMAEINFLCVHKKLRSKRVAPMMIKEVTRRVNLRDQWQAVYTAGVVLPKPIASCRYWHRSINPKKLIEVGFSRIGPRMTLTRTLRLYKLPKDCASPGLRPMTPADVASATKLLRGFLAEFKLYVQFTPEELAHWLLPRDGVVDAYVITDAAGEVTDLCSFYHLPSSIIGNEKHKTLFAAYSFYNVATTVPLKQLMRDCLIKAKERKVDVFNALDIMHNSEFLEDLKFGIGDGHLQYYLYNWKSSKLEPNNVGLVLL